MWLVVLGRNECGSNAMVTVQMTVEEYLEMKSRHEAKEMTAKQKNLVYIRDVNTNILYNM